MAEMTLGFFKRGLAAARPGQTLARGRTGRSARLLRAGLFAGLVAALTGCAVAPSIGTRNAKADGQSHYKCEQGTDFAVRFEGDSALIDSLANGREILLRDAGGLTPQQTVYSNSRLRAEFGLGPDGQNAVLRYLATQMVARCVRE